MLKERRHAIFSLSQSNGDHVVNAVKPIYIARTIQVITRVEFQEIVRLDGRVRGSALNTDAAYVECRDGREGLHKVEAAFRGLGYPLQYRNIKNMGWYPVCLRVLSLRIIRDVLDLGETGLRKMGDIAPKFSFLVRVGMNSVGLPAIVLNNVPVYWRAHYSVGDLGISEVNEQEGYLTVRLTNFKMHPILCRYLEGYFRRLLQFSFVDEVVECTETKCIYRGDDSHEYRISWK